MPLRIRYLSVWFIIHHCEIGFQSTDGSKLPSSFIIGNSLVDFFQILSNAFNRNASLMMERDKFDRNENTSTEELGHFGELMSHTCSHRNWMTLEKKVGGGVEERTRRAAVRRDKNCLSKRRNPVPLVYVSRYLLVSLLDSWLPCTVNMTVHYRETGQRSHSVTGMGRGYL